MSIVNKTAHGATFGGSEGGGALSVIPPPSLPLQLSPFEDRLRVIANSAACCFGLSVGNELGLFQVLSGFDKPASSTAIADEAKLHERYVREWLHLMVVSDIVTATTDHETDGDRYFLPLDRREALLGPRAVQTSLLLACLVPAYFPLLESFKEGGGLPYSLYTNFNQAMNAMSTLEHEQALLSVFVPSVPGLEQRLSKGIDACDLGCGEGGLSIILASKFPNSRFYGYDISTEAIKVARSRAAGKGLTNLTFEVRDGARLGNDCPKFHYMTAFVTIHDMPRPDLCLSEIYRVLHSDGVFSMVEYMTSSHQQKNIGMPWAGDLAACSLAHCVPVSMHTPGSMGLGIMWGWESATKMLQSAGFSYIDIKAKDDDMLHYHYLSAKASNYPWSS